MKTILTSFQFDTRNKDEREACEALRARLTSTPGRGHCMGPVWGDRAPGHMCGKEFANGTPVTLSTVHFFGNQWNTDDEHNARVFDWVEYCWHNNRHLVTGHYLDITPEMRAIRDNTNACGYCAHREPAAKGSVFCPQCLGSEYLKESDLHLLRMRPVSFTGNRAPLSDAERAHLVPLYHDAQRGKGDERARIARAKYRASLDARCDDAILKARTDRDVFAWLFDKGELPLSILSNVIFYNHTGRACFGWRDKMSAADVSSVLEIISEFPWPYDIKCADGRTLSGG
jgi:hypothetical protein